MTKPMTDERLLECREEAEEAFDEIDSAAEMGGWAEVRRKIRDCVQEIDRLRLLEDRLSKELQGASDELSYEAKEIRRLREENEYYRDLAKRYQKLSDSLRRDFEEDQASRVKENAKLRKVVATARPCVETYPEGHPDEGAFIVAFNEYKRLSKLEEALRELGEEKKMTKPMTDEEMAQWLIEGGESGNDAFFSASFQVDLGERIRRLRKELAKLRMVERRICDTCVYEQENVRLRKENATLFNQRNQRILEAKRLERGLIKLRRVVEAAIEIGEVRMFSGDPYAGIRLMCKELRKLYEERR